MAGIYCDHIHLKSADVEKTGEWYRDSFGGEITYRGQFRGSPVVYVSFGNFNLVIYGRLDADTEVLPGSLNPHFGIDHFGFRVDNLAAVVGKLRGKGVSILEEPVTVRAGVHMAYVEGPEHVRIELVQRDS